LGGTGGVLAQWRAHPHGFQRQDRPSLGPATGRETLRLVGHTDKVYDAQFSPDGRRIVTGSGDFSARIWDAANGRELPG
jgi:WD40 repeat protein